MAAVLYPESGVSVCMCVPDGRVAHVNVLFICSDLARFEPLRVIQAVSPIYTHYDGFVFLYSLCEAI